MTEPIAYEAFYPHAPERVWQALTDPAALAKWLLPTNFQPKIGFRFQLEGGPKAGIKGEVLEAQPAKKLKYTWTDEGQDGEAGTPSVVTWTLEPTKGGTKVRLEHQLLAEARAEDKPLVLIEANMNWRHAIHCSLPDLLRANGHPPVPIVYVQDEPEKETNRRAGFRQPEERQEEACRA